MPRMTPKSEDGYYDEGRRRGGSGAGHRPRAAAGARLARLLDGRRPPRSRAREAGRDLQLTAYGDGHWWARFWATGQAHSILGGSAWEETPWRTVQKAG